MIEINIKIKGKRIYDSYNEESPTLNEVALVMYRLEEYKMQLLSKEFKSEFEISEE